MQRFPEFPSGARPACTRARACSWARTARPLVGGTSGARRAVERKGWDMFIAELFKGKPAALHVQVPERVAAGEAFAGCVYADVRSECNATELRIEVRSACARVRVGAACRAVSLPAQV